MADDLEEILIDGEKRKMGRTLPTSDNLKMRAGLTNFTEYLRSKSLGLIPRSEWHPVSRRGMFGPEFINDQGQAGACVDYCAAQSEMKMRAMKGMSFVKLSGGYIYDQINGGRDNGACITDSMTVLMTIGTCPAADYPKPVFNRRLQPASLGRFKEELCLTCTTFDEGVTAILMGLIFQYPYQVGNNYTPSAATGWICGVSRGPGNHSVHSDGLALINGNWYLDHAGTWGTRWANNGRAYHSEAGVMGCAMQDDAYVKIIPAPDPSDPSAPPVIT